MKIRMKDSRFACPKGVQLVYLRKGEIYEVGIREGYRLIAYGHAEKADENYNDE